MSHLNHQDIRIGTLAGKGDQTPAYIAQIVGHGFESFQINFWRELPGMPLKELAEKVNGVLDDHAARTGQRPVISSLGMFGNPLAVPAEAGYWEQCIDACAAFNCDIVAGFAGALEDGPVDKSMARFKQVFKPLAKRAADLGVRLAFENCDMGGTWEQPRFNIAHSPRAWEMMFDAVPAANVGLEWEPCHQMVSLIDPLPQLRQWLERGRIFHLHGKDATVMWDVIRTRGLRGGQPVVYHRTPGFGDTNWTDVISLLRLHNFKGSIDIEGWHDPVYRADLEMTGQVHGLRYLQRCRGGEYVPEPTL